ncbi:histidine phosphatase family protein [Tsukamurella sp. PLM1]|uniref:histidine phosphatase family protein n=1 Tax=Tsukamurella sp. PLM1 TaxID=2929795 RepID=UPI00206873C6|nr:histidine phosphatase family protein [Tsukamurella sp. PLM1]BDH57479.1 putative phosphoglycerate/bisphosphoglycerate mutase [Tsukamurella sp. PLM1]
MTVILLRHGRSTANTSGVLAGRAEGVALDETGRAQAADLVGRLADLDVVAAVRSPLLRCEQTLAPLAAAHDVSPLVDDRLAEVDYGAWTGRAINDLLEEPLWKVVQEQPSAARFPEGESLAEVQARAVMAIREHDRRITDEFGPAAAWIACSHGDVIKAVVADALGTHLDQFQRIFVAPASVSVISYGPARPLVQCVNSSGSVTLPKRPAKEATVGGEA